MRLIWKENLGLPECPYLTRWGVEFKRFSIRLHRWRGSDDDRALHDHAWWFATLVLWGGYDDMSPTPYAPHRRDRLGFLSFRFRRAEHRHTVQLRSSPTWTLLITGAPVRRWAFYVAGKRYMRDKYFAVFGHHHREGDAPVRMKPDGTRIGG